MGNEPLTLTDALALVRKLAEKHYAVDLRVETAMEGEEPVVPVVRCEIVVKGHEGKATLGHDHLRFLLGVAEEAGLKLTKEGILGALTLA